MNSTVNGGDDQGAVSVSSTECAHAVNAYNDANRHKTTACIAGEGSRKSERRVAGSTAGEEIKRGTSSAVVASATGNCNSNKCSLLDDSLECMRIKNTLIL